VTLINGRHAVALVKCENHHYVFKNSYGLNNPKEPAWIKIPIDRPPARYDLNYQTLDKRVVEIYTVLVFLSR